jgi:CRISPR/Cas system-associated exonuclease Cas4 (RecB family)
MSDSNTFLGNVAEHLLENYPNKLGEITVVFPNRRASLFLKNELAKRIKSTIWLPKIITIEEALQLWTGFQITDPLQVKLELLKIHLELFPSDSQSIGDFVGYAELFIRDFDEIDQYLVDANALFSYLSEAKALELWHIDGTDLTISEKNFLVFFESIIQYYNQLKERLFIQKSGYQGMLARMLADTNPSALAHKMQSEKVIFAGFNALTIAEEKIIFTLEREGKAEILWDIDQYYLQSNGFELSEAGFFLRNFLEKQKNKTPVKWIFDKLLKSHKKIIITGVPGNVGQCKELGNNLLNETSFESSAVILSDENLLMPAINSIPSNVGKYNVTMGMPFSKSLVYNFLMKLFEFHEFRNKLNEKEGFYIWTVLHLFEHEFFTHILTPDDLERVKNLRTKLVESRKSFVTCSEIIAIDNSSQKMKLFLVNIFEPWNKNPVKCLSQIQNMLEDSIERVRIKLNGNHNYLLLNQFSAGIRICRRLMDLSVGNEQLIDIKSIKQLINQIAPSYSINFFGEPLNGLQIMGLLESRNLDFKTLHILSVNEGMLPAEKHNNSFIPFDLRQSFSLPIHTHKQAVFAYHFYRLLQSAENIHIYYNTESGELGGGEKSRFILQIVHEIARLNPLILIEEKTSTIPLLKTIKHNPIVGIKSPEIIQKIKSKAITGFSASSLSTYLSCQLRFYLTELMEIREQNVEEESIGFNTIGNILHRALKDLYEENLNKSLTEQSYKNTDKTLNQAFIKETRGELPLFGKNKLIFEVIKKLWDDFIEYEKKLLKQGTSLTVHELEKKYEYILSGNPENETNVWKLKGTIDRIDEFDNRIRIIDYKTGKVEEKDVKISEIDRESIQNKPKALQLLIYYYLLLKNNPEFNHKEIQPGIYKLLRSGSGMIPMNFPLIKNEIQYTEAIEIMLNEIVNEIFDVNLTFQQTSDFDQCRYCSFKDICERQTNEIYN